VGPRATYRVQLHAGFTFDDAAAIAGYLSDLGVSHLYLSPILQAAPGSTHGYDVVDPTRVNRELGAEAAYDRLGAALGAAGLGQLLDVVPNHMAITGRDNRWWWDVLRSGPASRYAGYFDVDWDSHESALRNMVLLPILGDHYGRELEAGRFAVRREGGEFVLEYFDHVAPIDPASMGPVLLRAAGRMEDEGERVELERLAGSLDRLTPAGAAAGTEVAERQRDLDMLNARLGELLAETPAAAAAVDAELGALNADVDALDDLLGAQSYRLAWWRTAGENLDYRRFFDINDLAALRVEEPQVFADSHWLILDWLSRGVIDGVRIDHVDGLLDPARYLQRLAAAAPAAWIVVEKILESKEKLRPSWPVAGTTGYEWLNVVGGVLTRKEGWVRIVERYESFTNLSDRLEEIVYRAKLAVLDGGLAADLTRLVSRLAEVCERHRRHRDHTRRDLHDALVEIAAAFPVYRTYVAAGADGALVSTPEDVAVVERAVLSAGVRRPDLDEDLLALVRDVLLGRMPGPAETEVALRFQQLTGPVMAKAVEDTAFYRYLALTSLNEVGGDPGHVDDDVAHFHAACIEAHRDRPRALLATSTHDTKRSEDVRARLSVLAEIPDVWSNAVEQWWGNLQRSPIALPPDRNTAWLILQTLVGAWPLDEERAVAYIEKATREAKEHTSWTDPDPVYDQAVAGFVAAVLDDRPTTDLVERLVGIVERPGRAVALSQKLLTLTAPGVPDLYQGSELWDLSLVDPDNRRPVDYSRRRQLLAEAEAADLRTVWASDDPDGLSKLLVVRAALHVRAEHPDWFGPGDPGSYTPVAATGTAAEHLVGFRRGGAVVVATRWPLTLERAGGWGETTVELPEGEWADRLGGGTWSGRAPLATLLGEAPVALLVSVA
jgi:(1->4)-alpha-D-glucan 1-alpha-D-glucosylmutase